MKTARVFKSGNSQAVRLPKEFAFASNEVEIFKRNNEVVLREKPKNLVRAYELLRQLSDCFDEKRKDPLPQKREKF